MRVFAEFINFEGDLCYLDPFDITHLKKRTNKSKVDEDLYAYEIYISVLAPNEYYQIKASHKLIGRIDYMVVSCKNKSNHERIKDMAFRPTKYLTKEMYNVFKEDINIFHNNELSKIFTFSEITAFAKALNFV